MRLPGLRLPCGGHRDMVTKSKERSTRVGGERSAVGEVATGVNRPQGSRIGGACCRTRSTQAITLSR